MADPGELLTTEKPCADLQNDREYLSEWPPSNDREDSEKFKQRKKQKLDCAYRVDERQSSGQESQDSESERVLWARPALARWWRKRQKETNLKDCSNKPKSDNPNTLLRYFAR